MRIGIIGFGGFGRFLHRAWSAVENVTVVAVADNAAVTAPQGLEVFESYTALLDSGRVDVVSIATPPSTHAEIAVAALDRGVHVLVEKPVAISLDDAARIIQARDASGCVASVNFMLRYNPIVTCMRRWAQLETFGSLQRVVIENYAQDESLPPDHWFWERKISGGILVEHGVHFFDLVNSCTKSSVASVTKRAWKRPSGLEDRVHASVEYENGLVASHYHAFNRLIPFERTSLCFVFDGAQVEIEGWIPMSGRIVALVGDENRDRLADLPGFEVSENVPVGSSRRTPLADSIGTQTPVDSIVSAEFAIGGSKEHAYLAALRSFMANVVSKIQDPSIELGITLEDGLKALEMAL